MPHGPNRIEKPLSQHSLATNEVRGAGDVDPDGVWRLNGDGRAELTRRFGNLFERVLDLFAGDGFDAKLGRDGRRRGHGLPWTDPKPMGGGIDLSELSLSELSLSQLCRWVASRL
jgi:hypothetical protein